MQCQELEHVLEENNGKPLPALAQAHIESCGACRNLVEDLALIQNAARDLPGEVEPPERIWVSLRSHLEAEKIIRSEPASTDRGRLSVWNARFLRPAIAAAAISALILAIVLVRSNPGRSSGPNSPDSNVAAVKPHVLMETKHQLNGLEQAAAHSGPAADTPTKVALRDNLKIVNSFIASCEKTVDATPQNDLAREYLSNAYQQKAELLAAIQDRETTGD